MSISRLAGSSDGSSGAYAAPPNAPTLGEDFPIICETCLGPNPYCRMIKALDSKECKISGAPFTAFRWQVCCANPSLSLACTRPELESYMPLTVLPLWQGALRRWKETIVCAAVAREKNLCQACLNDLEYAVPFHVRDSVMDALGEEVAPKSDVSKEFHWANKRQRQGELPGDEPGHDTYEKMQTHVERLRELAALNPGPVTWGQRRDTPLTVDEQEKLRQRRQAERTPPADKSVTSLYIGGVPPSMSKEELLPWFMPYGEVSALTVDNQRLSAVVTFRSRSAAETACAALYNNFTVKGRARLRISWARRKGGARAPEVAGQQQLHTHYGGAAGSAAVAVPPPKGGAVSGRGAAAAKPPPPGVRLPPGVKRAYPSMDPDAQGARPARE